MRYYRDIEMTRADMKAYYLEMDDLGKYVIIQKGWTCLGVGDTPQEAIAIHNDICPPPDVQLDDDFEGVDDPHDGDLIIGILRLEEEEEEEEDEEEWY